MKDLAQLRTKIQKRLTPFSDTASLDAQVLLAHVLGRPRSWVLAHPEVRPSASQVSALESALARMEAGQPLPYVLGNWEFFGLEFEVTPHTLIPRPETELMVELSLSWLGERPACCLALDVGTGTGCIAVAMAVSRPGLKVVACDRSAPALEVAQRNAQRHGVSGHVYALLCDLLPPTRGTFDLICANLPYLPSQTLDILAVGKQEPRLALDGGVDGLELIRRFLLRAPYSLSPGGLLLLEIGESQGEIIGNLAHSVFPGAEVGIHSDLAGFDRVVRIQRPAYG